VTHDLLALTHGLDALHGRFHAHITVAPSAGVLDCARELKLKPTVIDLERGERQQRDVMLTAYFRDSAPGAVRRIAEELRVQCAALQARGVEVLRVKLEQEAGEQLGRFTSTRYHEVHVKLKLPVERFEVDRARLAEMHPWVLSTNPRERRSTHVVQFLNLRLYEGGRSEADVAVERLLERIDDLDVVEIRRETALLDTHQALDAWWA
jgi:hypothetical protein